MSAQRERLANLIHSVECGCTEDGIGPEAVAFEVADALLARGVRVVDAETLAAALHGITRTETYIAEDGEVAIRSRSDESFADALLAALDGEADR